MPQKVKSNATETMSLLSVERLFISHFIRSPKKPPSRSTTRFRIIGFMILSNPAEPLPAEDARAIDIAALYASKPTTSSRATT